MRFALPTLFFCAFVTALSREDALEKWGGPWGGDMVSHGGNNIGNGNGGGISIDTGGGDIGAIGVGAGGGCDPAACNAKCQKAGDQSGYCDNGSGSPSLLGLVLEQTTSRCICGPNTSTITTACPATITTTTTALNCASYFNQIGALCSVGGIACPFFTKSTTTQTNCCVCDTNVIDAPTCSLGLPPAASSCGTGVVTTISITTATTTPCVTMIVGLAE